MVRLIALSSGTGEYAGKTAEEMITFVARVSSQKNQEKFEAAPKLLSYLIKNKHWSPFEHVYMTVEIITSRGIASQILRHRSFTFQEFSQRYAQVFETIVYQARRQDITNRQNSIDDMSKEDRHWFLEAQEKISDLSQKLYKEAIEKGIAKEQARFLLPLSTKTKIYMTGSVRSWIHYIELRTDKSTQKEHRNIAEEIKEIFKLNFPEISKALSWIN